MLILSRREAESISLGDDIVLTIVAVGNDKVRIGVKAPPDVRILRNELEVEEQVATIPFPTTPTEPADESQWQQRRAA
ncbi:MAG: carbon storage regulator [Planctomycetota bacterium]